MTCKRETVPHAARPDRPRDGRLGWLVRRGAAAIIPMVAVAYLYVSDYSRTSTHLGTAPGGEVHERPGTASGPHGADVTWKVNVMSEVLEVVIGVLGVALLMFSVFGVAAGFEAWAAGERIERCKRCGRPGLTDGGLRHGRGCPPGFVRRVEHPSSWFADARLREH